MLPPSPDRPDDVNRTEVKGKVGPPADDPDGRSNGGRSAGRLANHPEGDARVARAAGQAWIARTSVAEPADVCAARPGRPDGIPTDERRTKGGGRVRCRRKRRQPNERVVGSGARRRTA